MLLNLNDHFAFAKSTSTRKLIEGKQVKNLNQMLLCGNIQMENFSIYQIIFIILWNIKSLGIINVIRGVISDIISGVYDFNLTSLNIYQTIVLRTKIL